MYWLLEALNTPIFEGGGQFLPEAKDFWVSLPSFMKAEIRSFLVPEIRDLVERMIIEIYNGRISPKIDEFVKSYVDSKIYELDNRPKPKFEIGQKVWAGAGVQAYITIDGCCYNSQENRWVYQFYGPDSFGGGWYDSFTEDHLFKVKPENILKND